MKLVIRSSQQLRELFHKIEGFASGEGLLIDYKPYKPPRSLLQSRKLHAMIGELNDFTGRKNMKDFVKQLDFWPKVTMQDLGVAIVPKSEADLSKAEESDIIEGIYAMVALHLQPLGFEWLVK
ncbi:recombination protein NinB [Porticoccaceae bacterium]|nr:recombination protein NinB [Porticoccaceae bacterium]